MSEEAKPEESLPADMSTAIGNLSLAPDDAKKEITEVPTAKPDRVKIDILLKATGNAPIMKKKTWAVDGDKTIGWIMEFVKKYIKLDPADKLFLYVNQTFAPSPDQIVRNLYDCFGTEGKLILHYCKSQAWG